MLANSVVCTAVPVAALDRAQCFYGEMLSLLEASMSDPDEAFYLAGGQAMPDESPSLSAATGATR